MLRFRVSHAAWLHHKHACSLWALELLPPDPTSGQHQDGHPHFQSEVLKSFRWTKYPPHSKPSKTSCYLNFTLHNQFADFLSSTSFFHAQQCAGNHVFLQDHLPVFLKVIVADIFWRIIVVAFIKTMSLLVMFAHIPRGYLKQHVHHVPQPITTPNHRTVTSY